MLFSQGKVTPGVLRPLGITERAYYRWHKEHGGTGL